MGRAKEGRHIQHMFLKDPAGSCREEAEGGQREAANPLGGVRWLSPDGEVARSA